MRRSLFTLIAVAALACASARPARSSDSAVPSIQPVILGEVVEMNTHLVSVRATDGEILPLEFDSRTVMSPDMPEGTPVRVTFRLLDNGEHLAQRITPLEKGSLDWDAYENALALGPQDVAPATDDADAATMTDDGADATVATSMDGDVGSTSTASDTPASPRDADDGAQRNVTMPVTASPLPLAFATGLLLLAAAGGLWWLRRRDS
jgi:hypothetical protein